MLGFAWLTLRQANEAIQNGRLDEAQRLLNQPATQGHRRRGELLVRLARAFAERGERQLGMDDPEAAWRDLLQAEQLQTTEPALDRLRQALTRQGLTEVRNLLQVGEPGRAAEIIARLKDRLVRTPELEALDEAAKGWLAAGELADQGEFARAREAVDRVRRLLPLASGLELFVQELEKRQQQFAALLPPLHEAAEARRWRKVVEIAEQVLAVAPAHGEARKARGQAWKAVQPSTVAFHGPGPEAEPETTNNEPPSRFLLWIDGVGGYLVCLGSRVSLGQATPDARADVPLVADVSRMHATLTRDNEGYLLESVRPVLVNGNSVTQALLRPNDRITLGASCQLMFRQPVPVSTSARLDLVSGHRLPLGVDGVLLMAETLILGSGTQTHVTVPDLQKPLVLFRQKDGLGVRHAGTLSINGQPTVEKGFLGTNALVSGDEISFALEPVGTRMGPN
jgi:tetratricopeptide (TPR) repeat protein